MRAYQVRRNHEHEYTLLNGAMLVEVEVEINSDSVVEDRARGNMHQEAREL